MSTWRTVLYLTFAASLSYACFIRSVPDDFDRYIYEALVRGRYQSVEAIYPIIKHENPRAEASSVLDSPLHLGQLEPLYAIRPIYVEAVAFFSRTGISIQQSINLVSAVSLFGIAALLLAWTKSPLYSALLLTTSAILVVGRMGTPDALSALVIVAAAWAVMRNSLFTGVLLLILSVWVRTDNVLFAAAILGWLAWERKVSHFQGLVLTLIAIASVLFINHMTGNYGWTVLFHYSFVGGKYPAEIPAHVSAAEYVRALATGFQSVAPQLAPWILLGGVAWRSQSAHRQLLAAVALAAVVHFLLFPSSEGRYYVWAYLITGIAFILAVNLPPQGRITSIYQTRRFCPDAAPDLAS